MLREAGDTCGSQVGGLGAHLGEATEPTGWGPQSRPRSRQHRQAGVLGNAEPTPLPLAVWKHLQVGPRLHEGHKRSQLNGICMLGREDPVLRKRTWKVQHRSVPFKRLGNKMHSDLCCSRVDISWNSWISRIVTPTADKMVSRDMCVLRTCKMQVIPST